MTGFPGPGYVADRRPRLGYLDRASGLAVLVMIHTRAFYSWAPGARGRLPIEDAVWGVAALILAMLAVSIARTSVGGSRLRRRELVKA